MLTQTIERSRTLVLATTLLAIGGFAMPAAIQAQAGRLDLPAGGVGASVGVPDATEQALRSSEGASLDVIRKGGLILTVQGEMNFADDGARSSDDRAELVMFALAVDDGRIVDQWSARSRIPARTGETKLPGEQFLPGEEFLPGEQFIAAGEQFIAAGDAMQAVDEGRASVFFPSDKLKSASGVLLIAIPTCAGSSRACAQAEVSPYFITVVDGYRR